MSLLDDARLTFSRDLLAAFSMARIFAVGGAVRDEMLGRPVDDVDLVIAGIPREDLEAWLRPRGRLDLVGTRFGVYKFGNVDIALPRTEHAIAGSRGGYRDFDVQADHTLSIETDLARRDFTVNAMALDLRDGRLIDPHGGQSDLRAQLVRAVGDPRERFREDLSRILRGARIAVQLAFDIDPTTWDAMREMAGEIPSVVPKETIGKEIGKALRADAPRALALLAEIGFFQNTNDLARFKSLSYPALLSILLQNRPAADIRAEVRHLGASADDVAWIATHLSDIPDIDSLRPTQFEKLFLNERGRAYLEALEATGHADRAKAALIRQKTLKIAPPLLSGGDVIDAGVPEGPRVREYLDLVRDAQLNGKIASKDAALSYLQARIP